MFPPSTNSNCRAQAPAGLELAIWSHNESCAVQPPLDRLLRFAPIASISQAFVEVFLAAFIVEEKVVAKRLIGKFR